MKTFSKEENSMLNRIQELENKWQDLGRRQTSISTQQKRSERQFLFLLGKKPTPQYKTF